MLSIKLLDDYIIKEGDIKPFKIQLLRDMQPSPILDGCTATVIIADKSTILYEEPLTVVDAQQGIVEFTFKSNIGAGTFDCEFLVTNGDDIHLTFPDNGYTQLKITASLSKRPEGSVTKSEYAKLNERIDGVIELIVNGGVEGGGIDLDNYATDEELTQGLAAKQDKLVSGTNIKTINGTSILGSGDITIEGGTGDNCDCATTIANLQTIINELIIRIEALENGSGGNGDSGTTEPTKYTFTIISTPSDSIIKINNVVQNSVTVEKGTGVTWEVSKDGYVTQSGTKIVNATETLTINLVVEEIEVTLTSISATYTGGDVEVGTNVNDLKPNLSVKANYSDGSSVTVISTAYTLNGTIKEGNNTITVAYQGKTTTFTVVGATGYLFESLYEGAISSNSRYNYSELYVANGQDGAINNSGLSFRGNSDGNIEVRQIETGAIVTTMELDKKDILLPHSNSVSLKSFGGVTNVPLVFTTGTTYSAGTGVLGSGTRATTEKIVLSSYPSFNFTITSCTFAVCCYDPDDKYLGQVNTSLSGFATNVQWLPANTIITDALLTSLGNVYKIAILSNVNAIPAYECTAILETVQLYTNVYNSYQNESDRHIGECCVYEILQGEKNEEENTLPEITFEIGNLNSSDGSESVNDGRYRSNFIDITSIPTSVLKITNTKFIISCYDSENVYLGQIDPSFTQLITGSGQWLNAGTEVSISAITTVNSNVAQLRILTNSIGTTIEVSVDGEVVNRGGSVIVQGTEWINTLKQLIKIGFTNNSELWSPSNNVRPYGNFIVDKENDYLYAYTMHTTNNATYWHKFNLPSMSDGEYNETYGCNVVTLTEDDILASWQTSYQNYIQGATCHNGKLWTTEGLGTSTSTAKMKVIDPNAEGEKEIAVFDLNTDGITGEPEFIDFYENTCYLGTLGTMYKISLF